ncbi:hydroxymethylbilane synthase [Natronobacterium gregoryi]|uniref:Hydroxymethylbilane synthase n=2 Tax=Natronobacterium gregoryi TaxID=44930 RepID=L0AGY0_NATGS|nr:hydroxymethylbilane synthase [Natronobacterium gregoryi]AFZ72669.1 porphobilinogen deaminase [Natronobacterium gregoryi SP2]ELY69042.1 porphobilinogen deaminase [Natronobacterium gregoryi SP2]PLK20623.1 hydroxymethylbilane synthase [Natronobacterium gregoryi SP2]SFI91070.1 hydroxymethylbilane synthase [Natronobacterium gregoryi]
MRTRGTLRLATRGSTLARRQAGLVEEALEDRRYEVELVTVETTGDQIRDELIHRLGKTGAFVRELDERVLEGDLDGAIHSMKDMPTEQPDDLVTAAVPERGRPGDALVTPDDSSLEQLPRGATVGTSSLRRRAQLLSERPDLEVAPLRGNVDTRLEKLLAPTLQAEHQKRSEADKERKGNTGNEDFEPEYERTVDEWFDDLSELERQALGREVETEYDAIVLAAVGLERSGLAHYVDYQQLPTGTFVPAPGQGALAVTAADGETAREIREAIDHPRSRVETTVERTLLSELGGGCIAPIGIYAILQGEYVHANVTVFDRDGEESVIASRDLSVQRHAEAAREFASDLADRGAAELIESARKETERDDESTAEPSEGE